MEELDKYHGCLGCGVAVVVLTISIALGTYLAGGDQPPPALVLGGLVVGVALGIGTWKN